MSKTTLAKRLESRITRQSLERALCAASLYLFAEKAWPTIEPQTPFIRGKHIKLICDHLEAVTTGRIQNLVINMPPRCMKSLLVSVFWPLWVWIQAAPRGGPHIRWLFSSYSQALSNRDGMRMMRVISSPWFQGLWGDRVQIPRDQAAKTSFGNTRGGQRVSTSVGGLGTGEGGNYIVVDDPHNTKQALSDAMREAAITWWDETMTTRLDDPKKGGRVIVMQRLHQDDLTGHVLNQGGYEHLCLPMRYDPRRHCKTSIGEDWRKKDGELLWPERFGAGEVEDISLRLGHWGASAQLQQDPIVRGGNLIKTSMIMILPAVNEREIEDVARYWDKAGTEAGGARTAGVKMARMRDGSFVVMDVVAGQWAFGEREQIIRQTAELDGRGVRVGIEQEPGSGGKESALSSVANLAGFTVSLDRPSGDKTARAEPFATQVMIGNIAILAGAWNKLYLDECAAFPIGRYKDQVDASSGAFSMLTLGRQRAKVSLVSASRLGL